MLRRTVFLLTFGMTVAGLLAVRPVNSISVALAGRVNSDAEGLMEGVLVRAKGVDSITEWALTRSQTPIFVTLWGANIGRVDANTGKVTLFETHTLNSGSRRGTIDSEERF